MRKQLFFSLLLMVSNLCLNAQNVNIPDANFKNYLLGNSAINTNGDTAIQMSEASAFTGTINCSGLSISDLMGIEAFTNLEGLYCYGNQLTSIDVSQNTALMHLICYNNQLASLDVTQNTALIRLSCGQNQLTSLNVAQNTALTQLYCEYNQLTSIDVSQNTALIHLYFSNNQLTSLDVSQNTALTRIFCDNNQLTSLDVSQNTALTRVYCNNNQLTRLNLANGNNSILTQVFAQNNSTLTCIQHDTGFTPPTTGNWQKDATASWSDNCNYPCIVNIPDANFKAYLVGESTINTNGDTEIQCSEASAYSGAITAPFMGISNLTGIEAFTATTELYCNGNQLTSLDVSANTALTILSCRANQLSTLDISSNTVLTQLFADNNLFTSLNVANGNNTNMTFMRAQTNSSLSCIQHDTGFDPTTNSDWQKDATASWSDNCNNPCIVNIPDANFKAYLVNNSSINTNGNTEIECSEASAFSGTMNCAANNIADLTGIEAFVNITTLSCAQNQLTSIDLSQNTALQILNCNYNQLTALNLNQNTALAVVGCTNNNIDSLDLSNQASLVSLHCSNNALTYLNIANGNNSNQTGTNFGAASNPNLTCIQVDDVNYSTNNWTNIDATTSFSTNCNIVLVSSIAVQGQNGTNTIATNGGTLQMETTILPTNATDTTYTWSVVNGTGSATIDANGLLTAVANGTVIVVATANDASGVSDSVVITISNQIVLVSNIAVQGQNGTNTIATNGGTLQMEATILPANATDTTYTWSVVNGTGSATIDANGLLTAVANGTVIVVATANDASGVSDSVVITISNQGVGINEMEFNDLSIYPNPTQSKIYIHSSENINEVQIKDLNGKIVKTFTENTNILDLSHLAKGIYFMKLINYNKQSSQKIVLQ